MMAGNMNAAERSRHTLERALLVTGAAIWLIAAIAPMDRATWLLENILLAIAVIWIIVSYRKWRLSPNSYILLFIFFVLHVLGAHYTYSKTPIGDWLQAIIGTERNHYDRVVHFLFGLLIVSPFRDQVQRATGLSSRTSWGISMLIIISLGTMYELMEWTSAEVFGGSDTIAFLGTQGDVFDAQKDMSLAIAGGLIGISIALTNQWLGRRFNGDRMLDLSARHHDVTD